MKRFVLFLVVLSCISLVSAEITLTQPVSLYSKGDAFSLQATISEVESTTSFAEATLVCAGTSVQLYKSPVSVKPGAPKVIDIAIDLVSAFISNQQGSCFILMTYDDERKQTTSFTITGQMNMTLVAPATVQPGDHIVFSGNAKRATGASFSGTVRASIDSLSLTADVPLTNGSFTGSLLIPSETPAGRYVLGVETREYDEEELLNIGSATSTFSVPHVLSKVDIAVSEPTIQPGATLLFTPLAYDQSGESYATSLQITLRNSMGEVAHQQFFGEGESASYLMQQTSVPGIWTIEVRSQNLSSSRQLTVPSVMNASFSLVNNTLVVINRGNVPYTKPVAITIGSVEQVQQVNVSVGGDKTFVLEAPDGTYEVAVNDGSSTFSGSSFLTGKVISVNDPADRKLVSGISFVWIFLLVVLGFLVAHYYRKNSKHDSYSTSPGATASYKSVSTSSFPQKKTQLIDRGERRNYPVLALQLKHHPSTMQAYREIVEKAVGEARAAGAFVQENNGTWLAFFTMTGGEDVVILKAVKTAERMMEIFSTFNSKKSQQQIQYGLSIHFGELIVEQQPFKYTAMGSTISTAKKLASYADQCTFISDDAHKYVASTTRCEKVHDRNAWKLKSVNNRERHNQFINNFMKRQGMRR